MRLWTGAIAATLGALLASQAGATIFINEVFINPPGTDNGLEYFELWSNTGGVESLDGLWFLSIEGDGSTQRGTVDQAISLTGLSTGSNGLFLWRDGTGVLSPIPDPLTSLTIADFDPDLENGSNTFLLVSGFSGAVGDDLDADDDVVLNTLPWTSVIDGIGVRESDDTPDDDNQYATGLGFAGFPVLGFTPDLVFRSGLGGAWVGADVLGSAPGPFPLDDAETALLNGTEIDSTAFDPDGSFIGATPGSVNPTLIVVPPMGTPGDYNGDTFVDAADYTVWRDNLGQSLAALQNTDPSNQTGTVQPSDYDFWKSNFPGQAVGGAIDGGQVPEPSALAVAGLVVLACGLRRKR